MSQTGGREGQGEGVASGGPQRLLSRVGGVATSHRLCPAPNQSCARRRVDRRSSRRSDPVQGNAVNL